MIVVVDLYVCVCVCVHACVCVCVWERRHILCIISACLLQWQKDVSFFHYNSIYYVCQGVQLLRILWSMIVSAIYVNVIYYQLEIFVHCMFQHVLLVV